MNSVYFDPSCSDEDRRERLYNGQLFVLSPRRSSLALTEFARDMIEEAFDGIDPRTGNVNAGLLFVSFQRNPEEQFLPMLKLMQSRDALNEYAVHVASGMFACPRGLTPGEYIGQNILEA